MSNSGNTLNKKTIIAIVIIAVLLIAAIIGVVVFLKDQGETSAMAENGSQTSSDENVQARQEEQNQEPQEQAQTEEQNADTQNNEQDEPSTEVATTNDGANQGGATTNNDRANNSGNRNNNSGTSSSTGTTNSGNNANNNDNDAENIQESVIEETQTVQTEETVKTEEGEILSWTPQALATVSAIAGNMQLNAPNLVTEKTSTVYNDDGTRAEDQTKIALDQKVTYTIIIENRGNVEGTIEKGKTYDTLPKGFDYSKTRAEDYEFKVEKISATGESTTGDEVLSYSDFKFGKENATLESQTLILDKDVKLGAGEKLFITYSLKVDPKYLEDENGLVANKHIDKNVVTVNNLPVEDKNEYDGVQPLVKVEKTSRILRGEDLKETDIAKIADFIEYTIHIENNGEADTKVTVKDSDLEKILADGKAEFRSGDKTAEELINGFDIEVAHKDYVDIKFVIEIKDIIGAVENSVEVKDTTPQNPDPVVPENPNKVNTVNITATKGIITDGAVYEKDTLTYTITLQNSGNTEGTVSVKDSIPEGLKFKEGSIKINGDETEYTQNDLEDGNIKVTVPGNNGKVVVSFMVTADILDGKESLNIDNTAYVDDEPTNTVTTTVNKAYISVEVNKEWKDNDIQANRRPDKVTFILVADGEDTDTTLTVDVNKTSDKQNYKFEKPIAKYNKDGKQIKYTVREEGMGDFYKSTVSKPSVDANGNTAVTVTNEFKLPDGDKNKTDVTVTKIWEDNNNYAGKRTSVNIKITGSNSDKNTKTVTLKDNDAKDNKTWQITVNGMTKYDANGVEIKYTASEEKVPEFYKLVKIEGTTVTNEFELPKDTVSYTVNKVWDDNDIQAQRRPSSIEFVLTKMENGNKVEEDRATMTDTSKDESSVEFPNLPKYDDKANIIDYNVEEVNAGEFYTSTISDENIDNEGNIEVTVTNKFTLPENNTTSIQVTKVWDDRGHEDKRPTGGVSFDVVGMDVNEIVEEKNIELSAEDAEPENSYVWKKEVTLQKYDQNGEEIVYSATELTVPKFYTKSENGTTVTNKFVGDSSTTKDIKITKKWEDNNNKAKKRPQSVKFIISSDVLDFKYEETLSKGKSTSNEWTKTIKVRKYDDNANEINYKVDEVEVNTGDLYFYTKNINNDTLTITNKFSVPNEKVTVKVSKEWKEENDQQKAHRPDSVEFVLKAGDKIVDTKTMEDTAKNSSITFDPQAKYDELGNEINYTVEEKEVNEGDLFFYTTTFGELTDIAENEKAVTVTNTFKVPEDKNKQDLTLTKEWNDNNNEANKRPGSITLTLNGTDYSFNGNMKADKWTKVVKDLPIYDGNGDKIGYRVEEKNVPANYEIESTNNEKLTVINKFKVNDQKTNLTLIKEWDDNNNEAKKRPDKVTFKITGTSTAGTTGTTVDVTGDSWTKTVELNTYNKYNDPIDYSVEEVNVENGYVSTNPQKDGNTWKVTNSLPGIAVDKEIVEVNHNGNTITVGKDDIVSVTKGDIIKYRITVKNISSRLPLTDVVVKDKDLKVTYNTDGETYIISDGKIIDINRLEADDEKYVDVYYKVTENDFLNKNEITNTVNAEGKYEETTVKDSDSEKASVEEVPGISIKKTQKVIDNAPKNPGYVGEGDVIKYTITVTNTGNTDLTNVKVEDVMTGKHGYLDFIDENKLNIGTLKKEETKTIEATYTVTKEDISSDKHNTIENTATVTADGVYDKSTVTVDTEIGKPDISLSKKSEIIKADKNIKHNADGSEYQGNKNVAEPGDTIIYTITVKNNGNVTGTATVGDEIPDGTKFSKFSTEGIKLENDAFSTEVKVGPKGTSSDTKTIEFEVTVTAKAGTTIKNTATLDGTPSGKTTEDKVEKTVKVKTNTISNCNVVLVLDTSGSMKGSRMTNVKTAAKNLIDMLKLPAQAEENGPQISVVRYSSKGYYSPFLGWVNGYDSDASIISSATTNSSATTLKNKIDDLSAKGGTKMSEGLKLANQEIKRMDDPNDPNDKNIIIFLSDGSIYPSSSSLETESNVNTAVYDLKHNGVANQTIYTVPFGNDADEELLASIASGPEYCLSSSEDLSSLQAVFNKIINDTSKPVIETSTNGRVYLEDIDMEETDEITIKVDGVKKDSLKSHIKYDSTKKEYYLDLTEFNEDDLGKDIQIDYLSKS